MVVHVANLQQLSVEPGIVTWNVLHAAQHAAVVCLQQVTISILRHTCLLENVLMTSFL